MKTFNLRLEKAIQESPNLTLILPGGCNAHCDFCFWKPAKVSNRYINKLEEYLQSLPDLFTQCSISGGEPTYSKFLDPTLSVIQRFNFQKVVLTTNGSNLLNVVDILKNRVHFVNISRHDIDDEVNRSIFNAVDIPNTEELTEICDRLNAVGIEVNLNCVVDEDFGTKEYMYKFIAYARYIGASTITFRKNYNSDNMNDFKLNSLFADVKSVKQDSCPVCRLDQKIIRGMPVKFKYSLKEPSKHVDFIYELIYQPDGILYEDWNFEKPVKFILAISEHKSVEQVKGYSSCGGTVKGYSSC